MHSGIIEYWLGDTIVIHWGATSFVASQASKACDTVFQIGELTNNHQICCLGGHHCQVRFHRWTMEVLNGNWYVIREIIMWDIGESKYERVHCNWITTRTSRYIGSIIIEI